MAATLATAVTTAFLVAMPGGAARAALPTSGVGGPSCLGDQKADCSEPLQFWGDRVQHDPKVYLIFWGSQWNSDTSTIGDIINAFKALGGSAYNNILHQYGDSTGPVNNDVLYKDYTIDTNPIPRLPVSEAEMSSEANNVVTSKGWPTGDDYQFLIFPQPGSDPGGGLGYCGRHTTFTGGSTIAYIPWPADENCFTSESTSDSLIATAFHEYAEAATDPTGPLLVHPPNNWGWSTKDPSSLVNGGYDQIEVADKCQGYGVESLTLANLSLRVEPLWDQANNQCSLGVGQDFPTTDPNYERHTVVDPILTDYLNLGNTASPAGEPAGEQYAYAGGTKQDFATGAAYVSPAGKTAILSGAIATDYQDWFEPTAAHPIGWPASNVVSVPACSCGQQASFDNGTIVAQSPSSTSASWLGATAYATWINWHGPNGPLGWPTSNQTWPTDNTPTGNTWTASFQNGTITDTAGAVSVALKGPKWVSGQAVNYKNDYPWETLGQFGNIQDGTDPWNEYYGQCDSFAAWKVYENLASQPGQAGIKLPPSVPYPGFTPSDSKVSPVDQFGWAPPPGPSGGKFANADMWAQKLGALGYVVDTIPTPGSIAYWPNALPDPQDGHTPDATHGLPGSTTGHVAFVSEVYPDGSITIEQYNLRENGEYSVAHMAYGQGYTDNSFGHSNLAVPWPQYFIHVGDGPAAGVTQPAEPANGVVQATNATQVLVIGPGSPSSQFSTQNIWYNDPGYGELGKEMYTHTNGPTQVSTATWTPSLTASACYRVDALVPNQYSDNPQAIYTVADASGTVTAAVNENDYTGDWAELGIYKASTSGHITVTLNDKGNTGLYVAADAMRFWPQPCPSADLNAAPVVMPTYKTSTGWTQRTGHGFFLTEQYASTSGSLTTETHWADWSVTVLPNTCYDVAAYVPDNYSDNPAARYQVQDSAYINGFYPQVNENDFTNQFAPIGEFYSSSRGALWVELSNEGPASLYVAADALAFTVNPTCSGLPGRIPPAGATLIGLQDNSSEFSTTGNWHSGIGHGFYNHDLWIPTTTSGTPSATATWTANLSPNTCYNISAWVPNNYYADNTQASYQAEIWNGSFGAGGPLGTVDQSKIGDAWAPIGQVTTQTGAVTVTLGNTGNSGSYTAADVLAFQPC